MNTTTEKKSGETKDVLLALKEIHTFYGPIQALYGVSLEVRTGQIATIIGANGAGKSTLLMTIFSNPTAKQGQVLFAGKDITNMQVSKIAGLGIALVPEGRRVFATMTIEDNLYIGALNIDSEETEKTLQHVYDIFPLLQERKNQRAGTLSGGEQQMLAIGRALMGKPKLLLLDEPSLGLAPIIVRQIFEKLRVIAQEGVTVLLVEQNANLALKLAETGYVLVNGQFTLSGNSKDLLNNKEIRAAYLGG